MKLQGYGCTDTHYGRNILWRKIQGWRNNSYVYVFPLTFSLPAELWSPVLTVKVPPHATSYTGMRLQAYGGSYKPTEAHTSGAHAIPSDASSP
jgi:hypothetical protein